MSVSFKVSPRQAGNGLAERDTRRVQMARRVTAARLRYCGLESLVDDATLIVSELVTNAIQHSGGARVTFTMTVRDGFLRIAVHDEMPGQPVVRNADDNAEGGRGLFLVDCLAVANGGTWGTSNDGTTTWCNLALPGGQP
ncbi:ATP-binding protein [Streptomyces sp. GD-15H]|uniref:ATP-binding protein n=1 Tax=Streptomyces sp. GD-15H TaxID=3129112 RepID=UPI0032432C12